MDYTRRVAGDSTARVYLRSHAAVTACSCVKNKFTFHRISSICGFQNLKNRTLDTWTDNSIKLCTLKICRVRGSHTVRSVENCWYIYIIFFIFRARQFSVKTAGSGLPLASVEKWDPLQRAFETLGPIPFASGLEKQYLAGVCTRT